MNKSELIDGIREINTTASEEFLAQFNENDLQEYIDHLREIKPVELIAALPSVPYN